MEERNASSIRKEVDALMKSAYKNQNLSAEDQGKLKELADSGDPYARYYYGSYLISFEKDTDAAIQIWQELADENYAPAMATLGDTYFHANAPERWDLAYQYYTGEGAAALTPARRTAVKDILNHGKYNKRVLIMGILFCAISVFFMLLTSAIPLFHINAVLRIVFIALEAVVVLRGVKVYRCNSFSSLRWMLPDLVLIWFLYLLIWLM